MADNKEIISENPCNLRTISLGENSQAAKKRIKELFDSLQEEAEQGKDECYDFTWVGKRAAKVEFARPSDKMLRPMFGPQISQISTDLISGLATLKTSSSPATTSKPSNSSKSPISARWI